MPAGLVVLGVTLPHVQVGPTIDDKGKLAEVLFGLGLGVLGLVTLVYSMLFGVVQWSAGTFSPRLNLFRDDPLVWRTFAVTVGEFVFCVSAGLTISNTPQVSELVLVIAIIGTLTVFVMIRALQNHAFRSLQLGHVLAAVSARGRAVIDDLYPLRLSASDGELLTAEMDPSAARRTVTWIGPTALVQQLDLRQLVDSVAHADALVVFRVGVGGTLHEASPVADIHRGDLPDDVVRTAIVGGTSGPSTRTRCWRSGCWPTSRCARCPPR